MTLSISDAWDQVSRLLKMHDISMTAPTFERYTQLLGFNCMVANVRSLNTGSCRVRINRDWFHVHSDMSRPRFRGMRSAEGFDFQLIPTKRVLYAIHYMDLRACAFRLELDRERWFNEPWWGIRVNQEDDTFVWEGGNTISFPLLRVSSPDALAIYEKRFTSMMQSSSGVSRR